MLTQSKSNIAKSGPKVKPLAHLREICDSEFRFASIIPPIGFLPFEGIYIAPADAGLKYDHFRRDGIRHHLHCSKMVINHTLLKNGDACPLDKAVLFGKKWGRGDTNERKS